jgi:hypothetical protein
LSLLPASFGNRPVSSLFDYVHLSFSFLLG